MKKGKGDRQRLEKEGIDMGNGQKLFKSKAAEEGSLSTKVTTGFEHSRVSRVKSVNGRGRSVGTSFDRTDGTRTCLRG